jgi:acyl-coenzyme A synthetase/AMP-(fatty) acid ligase
MFDDLVRAQAQTRGNAPAIVIPNGIIPYWKFEADLRRAVHELSDLRVEPGESVSVAIRPAYLEWLVLVALARMGIATAPHEDRESRYRITDRAEETGPNLLFLSKAMVSQIISGPERPLVRVRPDPHALARVFRTSGTTGEPKRIALSWRVVHARTMHTAVIYGQNRGLWWVTTGSATPYGYFINTAAAACGCATALGFGPAIDLMFKMQPQLLGLIPVHLNSLVENIPADHKKWPLQITTGGSAFPAEVSAKIRKQLTTNIIASYGATECGGIAKGNLDLMEREPLAAGYIAAGTTVRLLDDDGEEVPAGESGRVCVTNDILAMGYLGGSDDGLSCFKDGWFHSADIARFREDGLLFLEGRLDELMNLGGHKVLPAKIDAAVAGCAGVKEAAAFAFRTATGIDRCGIAVVAIEGYDESEVRKAAGSGLMKSQSTEVMLVDSLPRNGMGKVERLKLRSLMEERLAAALRPMAKAD